MKSKIVLILQRRMRRRREARAVVYMAPFRIEKGPYIAINSDMMDRTLPDGHCSLSNLPWYFILQWPQYVVNKNVLVPFWA